MTVYHGTPIRNREINKGCYVSPMFERAEPYSRCPNNVGETEIGYIYELEIEENDVEWDAREDCVQGKLRKTVLAKKMVVCDIPLDLKNRRPPIRIKSDGTVIWANGKNIEWVSIISCKEIEWRQILERNLAESREADLVDFLGDDDAGYCRELARGHSIIFEWTPGNDYALFKKAGSS